MWTPVVTSLGLNVLLIRLLGRINWEFTDLDEIPGSVTKDLSDLGQVTDLLLG